MLTPEQIALEGRVALVTGAAQGIGRSIAATLGGFGARVLLVDRDGEGLEKACGELRDAGADVAGYTVDVTSSKAVDGLARELDEQAVTLDVLVNNVGDHLNLIKPFLESSEQDWDELYEINLKQVLRCTRAFAPGMCDSGRGGSIITISSIEGYRAIPTCAVYGALKTAIGGFVRSMAMELAPYGVRVNAVAPETTETGQVNPREFTHPQYLRNWETWNPLGRWGQPQDTASAVLFLASELSSWMTGTTLHVDGGALAAGGWYRMPGEQQRWTLAPVISDSGFIY
jgi:NAD(P)-dependent dehydrogenase (short-subunit alcohol dehydrogenase family)